MKNEVAIQNAQVGILYRVVGANAQPPGLRVGDLIRIEEDAQKRQYRHNLTCGERVLYYGTDPGVWVCPVKPFSSVQ